MDTCFAIIADGQNHGPYLDVEEYMQKVIFLLQYYKHLQVVEVIFNTKFPTELDIVRYVSTHTG